jgi:hypothetical protein
MQELGRRDAAGCFFARERPPSGHASVRLGETCGATSCSFTLAFASHVAPVDQVVAYLPGELCILDSPMPRRFGTQASLLLVQASNGITVVPVALPLTILFVHDCAQGLLNGQVPHPGLLWRMTLESPSGLTLSFAQDSIVELENGAL